MKKAAEVAITEEYPTWASKVARAPSTVLAVHRPVLLGDGVRLLDRPGSPSVELERLSLTHAPLAANLWFRVVGERR